MAKLKFQNHYQRFPQIIHLCFGYFYCVTNKYCIERNGVLMVGNWHKIKWWSGNVPTSAQLQLQIAATLTQRGIQF